MSALQPRYSKEEFARRGDEIYDHDQSTRLVKYLLVDRIRQMPPCFSVARLIHRMSIQLQRAILRCGIGDWYLSFPFREVGGQCLG